MFNQLKWVTFPEGVTYLKAIQMYKTVCGDVPDYLKYVLVFTSDIHCRLLRILFNYHLDPVQSYFGYYLCFQEL